MKKSVFFSNQRVLEVYSLSWLVDRFFFETIGIGYKTMSAAADRAATLPLFSIERKLSRVRNIRLYLPHTKYSSACRCCSVTFNLLGIIHLVVGGSSRGLC